MLFTYYSCQLPFRYLNVIPDSFFIAFDLKTAPKLIIGKFIHFIGNLFNLYLSLISHNMISSQLLINALAVYEIWMEGSLLLQYNVWYDT